MQILPTELDGERLGEILVDKDDEIIMRVEPSGGRSHETVVQCV